MARLLTVLKTDEDCDEGYKGEARELGGWCYEIRKEAMMRKLG